MGLSTLLLLGAIFVGSQGEEIITRQDMDSIRSFRSQDGIYDPSIQRQLSAQFYQSALQPQISAQPIPKASSGGGNMDKFLQGIDQQHPYFAQEMVKHDEMAKNQALGQHGLTTVCVQVRASPGNSIVCGPEISSGPLEMQKLKSSQIQQVQETKPGPIPKPDMIPVNTQTMMRVPMYRYMTGRDGASFYVPQPQPQPQPSSTCLYSGSSLNPNPTSHLPVKPSVITSRNPAEVSTPLGMSGESRQSSFPPENFNLYNWGAPFTRAAAEAIQGTPTFSDIRQQKPSMDYIKVPDTPLMSSYAENMARGIQDMMMRESENPGSSSSFMSTVPGIERSSDMNALTRLEESREKLKELTRELEEVKKARAAEEAARLEEKSGQQSRRETSQQQLSEDERKRLASQEPMRPAQMGDLRQ